MAEPNNDSIERLAQLCRDQGATNEVDRRRSRQRFLASLDSDELAPSRAPRSLRLLLAAVALLAVGVVTVLFQRPQDLTFTVEGAELSGQYVSAPERATATLRFSDTSEVVAAPGSHLRIEGTSPRGARVLLERGRTSVRVTHTDSTSWTFAAGPFEVDVTGTRFDLSWDPGSGTCEVEVHEGSVEVRGPAGSGPIALHRGQHFRGDATQRTTQVMALDAPSMADDKKAPPAPGPARVAQNPKNRRGASNVRNPGAPGRAATPTAARGLQNPDPPRRAATPAAARDLENVEPPSGPTTPAEPKRQAIDSPSAKENAAEQESDAPPEPNDAPSAASTPETAKASDQESWSRSIAQGKFAQVLLRAESRGIGRCLASCSASDLSALSDAARYAGRAALAERALLALRRRFRGPSSVEAAFLLARQHEKRGARAAALTWYKRYLSEASSGSFAAEALAGKFRAVKALRGARAARPIAREYVGRFPNGVHVRSAREILEAN